MCEVLRTKLIIWVAKQFIEINGWKVLGNGEAIAPDAHKFS